MSEHGIGRRTIIGGAALLFAHEAASAAPKPRVTIVTRLGSIVVELETQKAPITSTNFLRYVDAAKYDGGSFFRASRTKEAPTQGTIVAALAPKAQPYPPIAHESTTKTKLRHRAGTISLGRFAPGTARGDFFICASDQPYLDAQPGAPGDNLGYAAFGQVVSGMGVVRKILASPTSPTAPFPDQKGQWLKPPVTIVSVRRS